MKVFISGPVSNASGYKERFEAAEKRLIKRGYEVVNPVKVLAQSPFELPWDVCMEITLILLRQCDAIYMLEGWELSHGACIEREWAVKGCKELMFESHRD